MSYSRIMSVGEMISTAFGKADENIVNFKLIQAVLYVLARQLRVLERRIGMEIELDESHPRSNLSVTELKIHATVPKKRKGKAIKEEKKIDKLPTKTFKTKPKEKPTLEKTTGKTTYNPTEESTKASSDKTSSDRTKSSTDKSSSGKTTSSSKKSDTTSKVKDTGVERKETDVQKLMDLIEQQREKELRIIHQRADSRDVTEKMPTPMASLDSVEEQYEKLLIVQRMPGEEGRSSVAGKRTPQLSIVTQKQFDALANVVRDLQSRFAPIATPDFPDNIQLMQELRSGASLTDAMAALQLSARLEAAEKTLKHMLDLVTDIAVKSGIEIDLESKGIQDVNVINESTKISTPISPLISKKSVQSKQSAKSAFMDPLLPSSKIEGLRTKASKTKQTPKSIPEPQEETFSIRMDWITYDDLDKAMQNVIDGLMNTIKEVTTQCNTDTEHAVNIAKKLEQQLESSLDVGNRMNDLELLVSEYSEQINILDTTLSSQMTNYQEQLTQMQHDLEAGLEAMAEALANTGGDTAAVVELNTHFTNLQCDVDSANTQQKNLKECQDALSLDLQTLWQQIELLRETKSDRDEVADALRDKAGLGALNGLVSLEQFHAVRGDFEKRIGAAYDKFNNQEITWQKAIDDLLKNLNDKSDWVQLVSLRDDVNKNFELLRNKTDAMLEVVGEPRAATVAKQLFRDAACLSCSMPAHMSMNEPDTVPKLPAFPKQPPRPPTIGAEDSSKPAEDGDHNVCYPGMPIPHPRDPRPHVCQRYCGGSHTTVTDKRSRTPVGMIIKPALRHVTTGIGSDGKMYLIEDSEPARRPCLPCYEQKINNPEPSEAEQAPTNDGDSGMTPFDYLTFCPKPTGNSGAVSLTPPPPPEEL